MLLEHPESVKFSCFWSNRMVPDILLLLARRRLLLTPFRCLSSVLLPRVLRDQYFSISFLLLAGNSYMVTSWWCLTYTIIYLLVTRPPLTILTWLLESRWLITNTCSFLAVTWTHWVSSTSPIPIYSSAWLVPHHALLIFLLFSVTSTCTSDVRSTVTLLFLRVYKSVYWQPVALDLTSFVVLLYSGRSQ